EIVLEDHRARCGGDVPADLVSLFIGAADPALRHILEEQVHALRQTLSTRLGSELQGFRIGKEEIRWTHSVDELPHAVAHLRLGLFVELRRLDRVLEKAGIGEVTAPDEVETRVVAPRLRGEAS